MDLKNLLDEPANPVEHKPELAKRSSINDLVNSDAPTTQAHSSSPLVQQMNSPVLIKSSIPALTTPATHKEIRVRNSISSLTNDTDVDVDGKETPSIARRLSYEVSASESNSPVVPKKTITRAPSLQDMINVDEPIHFAEPEYKEDGDVKKVKEEKKEESKKEETKKAEAVTEKKKEAKTTSWKPPHKRGEQIETKPQPQSAPKPTPKNIDDELHQLESIEKGDATPPKETSTNGKPKRYAKPPIWAQKWVPQGKARASAGSRGRRRGGNEDRELSITGVKPYNDLTRRITNWVYSQIHSVPKEQRQFLELEIKFGRIWHKQNDRRVHVPVTSESIVDDGYMMDCAYKPGMEKEQFDRIKKFITGLTRLHKDKFKTSRTDHIDRTYREVTGGQMPKFIRLTTDKSTSRVVDNLQKIKMGNLHIHSPDLPFDYRFTMSIELPNHDNPERFQNHTPERERHKKRTSFFHGSTATRIDMTEVTTKVKGKNGGESHSFELELEVDMAKLLDGFDALETDPFTFEEITETLVDNARIINRELIKPIPK